YHFLETLFAEAIVLFVLNGLIIIVELSELVPGILFLIVGLILSITGLMLAFMSESDLDIPRHLEATFILIVGFACGEFGFIVGSQTDPKTEFNLFFGAFLVGLLMTYAFLQWFIE